MLLGDEHRAVVSGLGRDVEQHPGFAFAHARERAGAYALRSRDEPQLVIAVRLGLLEVVELQLHLLITGRLRADLGYSPVPFEPDGLAGGWYQLDGRHRRLLSQEAEEDPESDEDNYGRCRHARQNDSEILEAVEARGSGRSRPIFNRRPLRLLLVGSGKSLSAHPRKDPVLKVAGWIGWRGSRLQRAVHLPQLTDLVSATVAGRQVTPDLGCLLRLQPVQDERRQVRVYFRAPHLIASREVSPTASSLRNLLKALAVRVLTVPNGTPVRSDTSLWESPPK